jgi:transglutaminase-like putative cysteine protease
VGVFSVIKPHRELMIISEAEVITKPVLFPIDLEPAANQWNYLESLNNDVSFYDFLQKEGFENAGEVVRVIEKLVDRSQTPFTNSLAISDYINKNFEYKKGVTNVETETDEVWNLKAGVCQDFAHMLLVMLRISGMPARYVSGYICPKDEGVRGEGATHAWVETYIPEYGWMGLDPTNNCIVTDGHVRLAVGRSFSDCTPVKGTFKGTGDHTLEVSVHIENGKPPKHSETAFSPVVEHAPYTSTSNNKSSNSYRSFLEKQQQQQQQ